MAEPSRQIGWGTESNLLWQILKQLNRLTSVMFALKPKYKVFTALLNQNGADTPQNVFTGPNIGNTLIVGISYRIENNSGGADYTNIGAPNNNIGTYFIATGEIPANGGDDNAYLFFNGAAPVVYSVLENTLGNIWFSFNGSDGYYVCSSSSLFAYQKTYSDIGGPTECSNDIFGGAVISYTDDSSLHILTWKPPNNPSNDTLCLTRIEIRVYN